MTTKKEIDEAIEWAKSTAQYEFNISTSPVMDKESRKSCLKNSKRLELLIQSAKSCEKLVEALENLLKVADMQVIEGKFIDSFAERTNARDLISEHRKNMGDG